MDTAPTGSSGTTGSAGRAGGAGSAGSAVAERLPLTFAAILMLEALTILALYWFGTHFS